MISLEEKRKRIIQKIENEILEWKNQIKNDLIKDNLLFKKDFQETVDFLFIADNLKRLFNITDYLKRISNEDFEKIIQQRNLINEIISYFYTNDENVGLSEECLKLYLQFVINEQ